MSLYSTELQDKIRETLEANASLMFLNPNIQVGELEEILVAEQLQQNFSKLPGIQIDVESGEAQSGGNTTNEEDYSIPVRIVTLTKGTHEVSRNTCRAIVELITTIVRNQKSSTQDFSGHGGMTSNVRSKITIFKASNQQCYAIGETFFDVNMVLPFQGE